MLSFFSPPTPTNTNQHQHQPTTTTIKQPKYVSPNYSRLPKYVSTAEHLEPRKGVIFVVHTWWILFNADTWRLFSIVATEAPTTTARATTIATVAAATRGKAWRASGRTSKEIDCLASQQITMTTTQPITPTNTQVRVLKVPVKPTDSVVSIAVRYGVSVSDLRRFNRRLIYDYCHFVDHVLVPQGKVDDVVIPTPDDESTRRSVMSDRHTHAPKQNIPPTIKQHIIRSLSSTAGILIIQGTNWFHRYFLRKRFLEAAGSSCSRQEAEFCMYWIGMKSMPKLFACCIDLARFDLINLVCCFDDVLDRSWREQLWLWQSLGTIQRGYCLGGHPTKTAQPTTKATETTKPINTTPAQPNPLHFIPTVSASCFGIIITQESSCPICVLFHFILFAQFSPPPVSRSLHSHNWPIQRSMDVFWVFFWIFFFFGFWILELLECNCVVVYGVWLDNDKVGWDDRSQFVVWFWICVCLFVCFVWIVCGRTVFLFYFVFVFVVFLCIQSDSLKLESNNYFTWLICHDFIQFTNILIDTLSHSTPIHIEIPKIQDKIK